MKLYVLPQPQGTSKGIANRNHYYDGRRWPKWICQSRYAGGGSISYHNILQLTPSFYRASTELQEFKCRSEPSNTLSQRSQGYARRKISPLSHEVLDRGPTQFLLQAILHAVANGSA